MFSATVNINRWKLKKFRKITVDAVSTQCFVNAGPAGAILKRRKMYKSLRKLSNWVLMREIELHWGSLCKLIEGKTCKNYLWKVGKLVKTHKNFIASHQRNSQTSEESIDFANDTDSNLIHGTFCYAWNKFEEFKSIPSVSLFQFRSLW
jgi:hypothetical protein